MVKPGPRTGRDDEAEENGSIAQAMLDIKNEENLPDGIENAFTVEYGVMIDVTDDLAIEDVDAAEDNPKTGVVYAVMPMAIAASAIAILRKKR